MSNVLILTCYHEKLAIKRVAKLLQQEKLTPLVVYTEDILSGKTSLSVELSEEGLQVWLDHKKINLSTIRAAWYRRPLGYEWRDRDAGKQLGLRREYRESLYMLWAALPDERWLNPPEAMYRASHKLYQLQKANEVGLMIPKTLITNEPREVAEKLQTDPVILKSHRGRLFVDNELRVIHTTSVQRELENLSSLGSPFPGIWQEYQSKKREWRVTIVGEQVFAVSIYTKESAKIDWRMYQHDRDAVDFKSERLPSAIAQKCKRLLKEFGLNYGGFDLVETPEGQIMFLEVNANGQFLLFDELLGLPICEAIAHELVAIAKKRDAK